MDYSGPGTLTLARHISDAVAAELAATDSPIRSRSLGVEHAGIRQRWIVICTASSRQRAQNSVQREYVKQGQQEVKAFHFLSKQSFFCLRMREPRSINLKRPCLIPPSSTKK